MSDKLRVTNLESGIVIDHIKSGKGMEIYRLLGLDSLESPIAIIKNVKSQKHGKKDIIKIDGNINVDYDILGFVDPNATVSIIENGKISGKKPLKPPDKLTDVIKCKNPRCILSIEADMKHTFVLADTKSGLYRCFYCQYPPSAQP